MSSMPWPPPSLEMNAEAIVNECEEAEMTPLDRPMLAPIHMAALLYLGEYVHARHLWRRRDSTQKDELMQDWWEVGKCMIQATDASQALQKCATTHPEPLKTYAVQLAAVKSEKNKQSSQSPVQQQLNQQIVSFLETTKWNA